MVEQSTHANEASGMAVILAKFFPAAMGALMIAVDPPKTKCDLFARVFVAFAASYRGFLRRVHYSKISCAQGL
ncbi:MAG: hypothetical protein Q7K57_61330 [Burkholderiaceae bacterium]|nr:hypothetical protein [Burkholderiaceae bacterium]